VEFRAGSLFEPVAGERFDVIASNPPYVAAGEADSLAAEVREWEPPTALFAGPTGLEVTLAIAAGAPAHLAPGGLLALEVGAGQAAAVRERLERDPAFALVSVHPDLAGLDRIVLAERAGR
jgi:release factor glutamine methyltransferase